MNYQQHTSLISHVTKSLCHKYHVSPIAFATKSRRRGRGAERVRGEEVAKGLGGEGKVLIEKEERGS